jgi:hypothetical protein
MVKKRILWNILKMENICRESSKIINYLAQIPTLTLCYGMLLLFEIFSTSRYAVPSVNNSVFPMIFCFLPRWHH